MPNKDFFNDSSIVPAKGTTAVAPYQPNQMNTALMLAAADPATRKKITNAVLSENCRTLLTITALESAVMLSAIEEQCNKVSPGGQQRYKAICDSFCQGAINKIMRW